MSSHPAYYLMSNEIKGDIQHNIYNKTTKLTKAEMDIETQDVVYSVSLWFMFTMIHETPIWNIEGEGCDHVDDECHKASNPRPRMQMFRINVSKRKVLNMENVRHACSFVTIAIDRQ